MWMILQFGHQSLEAVHRTWTRLSLTADSKNCEFNRELLELLQSMLQWELYPVNCVHCSTWMLPMSVVLLTVKPFTPEVSLETFFCVVGGDMHTDVSSSQPQTKKLNASKESRGACSPSAMSTMQQHCTAPTDYWIKHCHNSFEKELDNEVYFTMSVNTAPTKCDNYNWSQCCCVLQEK